MADAGDARRTQRRVNTLLRDRDAIRRMLEPAAYERLGRDLGRPKSCDRQVGSTDVW